MFHGYLIVAATFLLKFFAIGIELSAAVFILPLQNTFHATRGTVALLESIYCSVGLFTSLFGGTIQSIFASCYGEVFSVKPMFAIGSICIAVGSYLASYADTLFHVLSYASIVGVGIGLTGYLSSGVCSQWFDEKNRAWMILLSSTGSGFGGFALTHIMGYSMSKLSSSHSDSKMIMDNTIVDSNNYDEGWRIVMRNVGVTGGVVSLLISLLIMRLPFHLEVELHEHEYNETENKENVKGNSGPAAAHLDVIVDDEEEDENGNERINNHPFDLRLDVDDEHIKRGEEKIIETDKTKQLSHNEKHAEFVNESTTLLNRRNVQTTNGLNLSLIADRSLRSISVLKKSAILHHHSNSTFDDSISFSDRRKPLSSIMGSIANIESLRELPIDVTSIRQSVLLETKLPLMKAVKTQTSLCVVTSGFFLSFGLLSFFGHFMAYAESISLSEDDATQILSLANFSMVIGNIIFGFAVNSFGSTWVMRFLLLTLMFLNIAWPHCYNMPTLFVVAIVYGLCTTVTFNLLFVILADAFASVSPTTILHLSGLLNALSFPGYLLGPSIVGYFYDIYGSYTVGSMFTASCVFLSFFSLCFVPSPDVQRKRLGIQ